MVIGTLNWRVWAFHQAFCAVERNQRLQTLVTVDY